MRFGQYSAALLLGAAAAAFAHTDASAQTRPDTARASSADTSAMHHHEMRGDSSHAATHPREMQGDSSHAGMSLREMQGDSSHAGMHHEMRGDSAHAGMRHDPSPAVNPPKMDEHAGHAMPGMQMGGDTLPRARQPAGLHDAMSGVRHAGMKHEMLMRTFAGGWQLLGMAQAFAMTTWAAPREPGSPVHATESYLTQPAVMVNVLSPGARVVLRSTLNLEAVTQPDGEITFGGWGEGFIDRRHPHTFLHEAMLSLNAWEVAGGALSLSGGKGFAAYGTDDPMSRPVAKYPTNHHLSQILERWTVNGAYTHGPWSAEGSIFSGQEPDGPWDRGNVEGFGRSFSARVIRRFGGEGTTAPWELGASYGSVEEPHGDAAERTALYNATIRHSGAHAFGGIYAMAEASLSDPEHGSGVWSLLGETQVRIGRHRPYYRVEYATRPEYARLDAPGTPGFYRYDHDGEAIGATRWLIQSLGYEYDLSGGGVATRPYIEVQSGRVRAERGGIDPVALYGDRQLWTVSAGFRLFFGGGPMRMGTYGVLDDMTLMHHPVNDMAGMPGAEAHR